jgi:chromosome segregation ATPase
MKRNCSPLVRSYRSRFSGLQKENESLRDRLNQQAAELELRNRALQDKEDTLNTLNTQLAAANTHLTDIKVTVENLQAEVNKANSGHKALEENHSKELDRVREQHLAELR